MDRSERNEHYTSISSLRVGYSCPPIPNRFVIYTVSSHMFHTTSIHFLLNLHLARFLFIFISPKLASYIIRSFLILCILTLIFLFLQLSLYLFPNLMPTLECPFACITQHSLVDFGGQPYRICR